MISKRDAMTEEAITRLSKAAQSRVLENKKFETSRSVGAYFAFGSEVRTDAIIDEALRLGKKVSLPRVEGEMIRFYEFSDRKNLVSGKYGILEPLPSSETTDIDLLVVPGVAFDMKGYRLGYGKAYYDKYLSHDGAYSIGLAFSFQVIDRFARDPHDKRLNALATDQSFISFDEK
jgi:5-formyltetrahydrofolate cyclo-ligase